MGLRIGSVVRVKSTTSQFKNAVELVGKTCVVIGIEKEFGCEVYLVENKASGIYAYFNSEQLEVLNG